MHCVGNFEPHELEVLARHDCVVYQVPASEPGIAENIAHFYLSQVLDKLAADRSAMPDRVLVLDGMSAVFPRDPFLSTTTWPVGVLGRPDTYRRFGLQPVPVGTLRAT